MVKVLLTSLNHFVGQGGRMIFSSRERGLLSALSHWLRNSIIGGCFFKLVNKDFTLQNKENKNNNKNKQTKTPHQPAKCPAIQEESSLDSEFQKS